MGANTYCYDQNGNMTQRKIGGNTYALTYDKENHLTGYNGGTAPNDVAATFAYDGDGQRVMSTINGVVTRYLGSYYEVSGTTAWNHYFFGGQRIAERISGDGLYYILSDHLGSTSMLVKSGTTTASWELRYIAFGEKRFSSGTPTTTCQYIGQRNEPTLGINYYNACWYGFAEILAVRPRFLPHSRSFENYHTLGTNRHRTNFA